MLFHVVCGMDIIARKRSEGGIYVLMGVNMDQRDVSIQDAGFYGFFNAEIGLMMFVNDLN
jgi:hypothetical protein